MQKTIFNWGVQCQATPYIPAGKDKPVARAKSMFSATQRPPLCPQMRKVLIGEMAAKLPKPYNASLPYGEQLAQIAFLDVGEVVFMPPALSKRIHCYSKRLGIRCVTQDGKVMRWD